MDVCSNTILPGSKGTRLFTSCSFEKKKRGPEVLKSFGSVGSVNVQLIFITFLHFYTNSVNVQNVNQVTSRKNQCILSLSF